jgi:hypothetical protein
MARTLGQFNADWRRIEKLEAMAQRPGTPDEGAAARAAIERIRARLPAARPTANRQRKPQARRPDGRPLRMDEKIICDAPEGVYRACRCGGVVFTVFPGIGPHAAQLVCDVCGRGGRWLSRANFEAAA